MPEELLTLQFQHVIKISKASRPDCSNVKFMQSVVVAAGQAA
jgi:hypothetical protein